MSADHLTRFQLLGSSQECGDWSGDETLSQIRRLKVKVKINFMNVNTYCLNIDIKILFIIYLIPDDTRVMFTSTEPNQFTRAVRLRSVNRIIFFTLIPV